MRSERRGPRAWLVAGLVLFAGIGISRAANTTEPCCFINDRYAGVCKVIAAQDETCASILKYLNSPNSAGKSYCNNTAIRGDWSSAKCGTPAPR